MRPQYATVMMYISTISPLLAIWIGRRQRNTLWWYAVVSFIADVVSISFTRFQIHYNGLVGNIWQALQLLLIGYYFARAIFPNKGRAWANTVIAVIVSSFVVGCVAYGFNVRNHTGVAIVHSFLLFISLAGLIKVIRDIEHIKIEHSPLFILSSAFLVNSAGLIILDTFHEYFVQHIYELNPFIWCLRNAVNILVNLAIAYIFYLEQQKAKRIGT